MHLLADDVIFGMWCDCWGEYFDQDWSGLLLAVELQDLWMEWEPTLNLDLSMESL